MFFLFLIQTLIQLKQKRGWNCGKIFKHLSCSESECCKKKTETLRVKSKVQFLLIQLWFSLSTVKLSCSFKSNISLLVAQLLANVSVQMFRLFHFGTARTNQEILRIFWWRRHISALCDATLLQSLYLLIWWVFVWVTHEDYLIRLYPLELRLFFCFIHKLLIPRCVSWMIFIDQIYILTQRKETRNLNHFRSSRSEVVLVHFVRKLLHQTFTSCILKLNWFLRLNLRVWLFLSFCLTPKNLWPYLPSWNDARCV